MQDGIRQIAQKEAEKFCGFARRNYGKAPCEKREIVLLSELVGYGSSAERTSHTSAEQILGGI
jgi:hypothetical protein